jgi:hypothetical protein
MGFNTRVRLTEEDMKDILINRDYVDSEIVAIIVSAKACIAYGSEKWVVIFHKDNDTFDFIEEVKSQKNYFYSERFDAGIRVKEIENSILDVKKSGLKVGINNSRLFVENTTYTDREGYDNTFGYAEIDCFSE